MNDPRAELREIARLAGGLLERLAAQGVDRIPFGASAAPGTRAAADPRGRGNGATGAPPPAVSAPVSSAESAARTAVSSGANVAAALARIEKAVAKCRRCALSNTRTRTVFGAGSTRPPVVFIGEAPGAEEDRQGIPFVGRAGQLLTKMLACIGFGRGDVYITNILKCRPPGNRDPQPQEVACCEPYLLDQLSLLKPRLICALGRHAAQTLLKTDTGINKLRGRFHDYHGISILPTFHPAYLLRNPADKGKAWEDLKRIRLFVDGKTE